MQSRISPSTPLFQLFKAAAAAYMAVHCHGRQQVRLHDGCITTSSENDDIEEVEGLSEVKVVADAETSRKINVFLGSFFASAFRNSWFFSSCEMTASQAQGPSAYQDAD